MKDDAANREGVNAEERASARVVRGSDIVVEICRGSFYNCVWCG